MNRLLAFLFSLALLAHASGSPASPTADGSNPDGAPAKGLFLEVKADAFVCDAEYFLPRTKGFTYVGTRLLPALRYSVNDQVSLRAGILLTALAGHEGLWKVQPVLSFDFSPAPWLLLRMGTIDSDRQHLLGDPICDHNRWFYDYKQDGMQILTHTQHWESDSWLDWQHFLEPWTPDQERFSLGTRHQFFLFNRQQAERLHWQVSLPLAFVGNHRGGQVSTLDTCIETLFNEQVGLRATWNGNLLSFSIDVPLFLYQNGTPHDERHQPYDNGWGVWPSAQVSALWGRNHLQLQAGFWRGSQFISPHGNALFMSISDHDDYLQPDVHLATLSAEYLYRYKDFTFGINLHSFYDTDLHKLDLDAAILMRFSLNNVKLH